MYPGRGFKAGELDPRYQHSNPPIRSPVTPVHQGSGKSQSPTTGQGRNSDANGMRQPSVRPSLGARQSPPPTSYLKVRYPPGPYSGHGGIPSPGPYSGYPSNGLPVSGGMPSAYGNQITYLPGGYPAIVNSQYPSESLSLYPKPKPDTRSTNLTAAKIKEPVVEVTPQSPETSVYWFAATHAHSHIVKSEEKIAEIFSRYGIGQDQYLALAGFDEYLVEDGGGFLEQIHIMTSEELGDPALLPELGKVLSPFSSVLFTPSTTHEIPVYKEDGAVWERWEIAYQTAKEFDVNDGVLRCSLKRLNPGRVPNACQYLPLTSLSQSPSEGNSSGSVTPSPRSSSSSATSFIQTSDKGKGKADQSMESDTDDDYDDTGGQKRYPKLRRDQDAKSKTDNSVVVNVVSEIRLHKDAPIIGDVQTISMRSALTLNTLTKNCEFPSVVVNFTDVKFGTTRQPGATVGYYQYHLRVGISSDINTSDIAEISPRRTATFEESIKESSVTEEVKVKGLSAGLVFTKGVIGMDHRVTSMHKHGHERTRLLGQILENSSDGSSCWDFTIADPSVQRHGIHLPENDSPRAKFLFPGGTLPNRMMVTIGSFWSFGTPASPDTPDVADTSPNARDGPVRPWYEIWRPRASKGGSGHAPAYSNFCQMVTVTVPTRHQGGYHHKMRVKAHAGSVPGSEWNYNTKSELISPPGKDVFVKINVDNTRPNTN